MKTVEKRTEKIEKTYEHYKCDICGKDTELYPIESKKERFELKVRDDEESYNYGTDGGYTKDYIYDVCQECIEKKIFPYIKELTGKEPRVDEYNW